MYKRNIALFEIVLLLSASVAFSYMAHQSDSLFPAISNEGKAIRSLRAAFINFFGSNLVSAEEPIWTCPLDTNGARCQEYGAAVCDGNCTTSCFQGARRDFADCREGTCLDPDEGTCSPNTPQILCQEAGGIWDSRTLPEIPACRPGCCLLGSQALFRTERACDALRIRFNAEAIFQPVTSELECLALANREQEGACVLNEVEPNLHGCRFTTGENCNNLGGTFYNGLLCSNPDLNTTCIRQSTTNCVDGKDEVYWFDSCGNRENIYDSLHREDSWNNGLVLAKNQSCELGSSANPLLRQTSCGNCNYLQGNRCGTPRENIDDEASIGDYVCRDLSCTDDDGSVHQHGESWCAFDSRIGVQGARGGNDERSVDVPGSQHYRKTCANGVISTETCGTFRNQICVESEIDTPGPNDFSQAACRPNQWQLCMAANQKSEGIDDPTLAAQAIKEECDRHVDCYMKGVDLRGGSGSFAFGVCLPKYPPAFDLQSAAQGEEAQALCSFGTVTCKYVTVKKLFGGSKKYNTLCVNSAGAETMNNLCMSLGDCGAQINTAGDYSDRGFLVTTDRGSPPTLTNAYIAGLRALMDPRPDQRVEPLNSSEMAVLLGTTNTLGDPSLTQDSVLGSFMMISGMGGIALAAAGYFFPEAAGTALYDLGIVAFSGGAPTSQGLVLAGGAVLSAAAGALIGAAGISYILDALGITAGLPPAFTYALLGLGAFSGGAIGYGAIGGSGSTIFGYGALTTGLIALIALVIIIVILFFLGIGKKKETQVNFQCLPWQPPLGGAKCDTCGGDGLPCSKYTCQSLGQACRYVENSAEGQCINAGINDIAAPSIREDPSVLLPDYQYQQVSERGYQLVGPENGCVPRFMPVRLGITTDELAQCKVANHHTENFDSMEEYFHRFNDNQNPLFRRNHTMQFSIASNEAIENEQQIDQEFDDISEEQNAHFSNLFLPDSSGNVNLYVRCTDASGNKNIQEYAINFCVTDEPDRTAPLISLFEPASPGYVALGASQRPVTFWLNEPAECRWSEGNDRSYVTMINNATCATSLADGTVRGWACNATLPIPAGSAEHTFYFRCNDQPWVNESDPTFAGQRNANSQGVPYVVRPTSTPLQITSVSPNNQTVFVLGLPARVNFTVITSGGAEGARYCSYRSGASLIRFFETGGDRHQQQGITLVNEGNYSYPIFCEDVAGNTAQSEIRFELAVDDEGPEVSRVYSSNGRLTVITNEFARCAFSLTSCSFSFANGTLMDGEAFVHTSPFESELSHYIQCRDLFDNPGRCTTVRGGTL